METKDAKWQNSENEKCTRIKNTTKGITLIALIITIIVKRVFYDKNKNISNLVGFCL